MDALQFRFLTQVMPQVRTRGRKVFAKRADRAELIADAISLAWESLLTLPPDVPAKSIAYYACKRAKAGRQFSESSRSITGPNPRRRVKPLKHGGDPDLLPSGKKDNPADVASVRVDFTAWVATLTEREKDYLISFLFGETTAAVAKHFKVSPSRVSQMRRELLVLWEAYTG